MGLWTSDAPILVTDFISEFQPALRPETDRSPSWFAARYVWSQSTIFFKLLDLVGQNYRDFKYSQRQPRDKPVIRSWFPGYVFLEIDLANDYWQQIYTMPGFLEILGHPSALPDGMIEALDRQLAKKLPGRDPGVRFNPGDAITITAGPLMNQTAIVLAFNQRKSQVDVVAMFCGRPCKASLHVADVKAA